MNKISKISDELAHCAAFLGSDPAEPLSNERETQL
jgi:hypothetical protein